MPELVNILNKNVSLLFFILVTFNDCPLLIQAVKPKPVDSLPGCAFYVYLQNQGRNQVFYLLRSDFDPVC